jgi:uncharacterized membrane protein HdeD (DUF308 family)
MAVPSYFYTIGENIMTATTVQLRQSPWWVLLIKGILAFIVGAILLWSPAKTKIDTWMLLITILGIWWLVSGIVDIVSMFTDHTAWGWKLFTGIVSIIAGGYILTYPVASAMALPRIFVLVMGFWGLMQGIVLLFMAFRGGGWGAGIVGVFAIILGIVLIGNYSLPGMGLTFVWVAAVWGVIGGVIMIIQAFRQRKA